MRKPIGYLESFDGRTRDGFVNQSLFFGLHHARSAITEYAQDCVSPALAVRSFRPVSSKPHSPNRQLAALSHRR